MNTYEIDRMGAVIAIRIFEVNNKIFPQAELYFALTSETRRICWTNPKEREIYLKGINGYTIFYDERAKTIPLKNLIKNNKRVS